MAMVEPQMDLMEEAAVAVPTGEETMNVLELVDLEL
jgi:hypothetical protein